MKHLLAAEADKIQDFLFRSSKLREVVGGSQLLTRFCQEAAQKLLKKRGFPAKIVTADGGGFRILFDDKASAETFGRDLATLYRWAVDGSLTIAEPAEVAEPVEQNGNFRKAIEKADDNLRQAKQYRFGGEALRQLPYMAICASCGTVVARDYKPAREHKTLSDNDNPANYVCHSCRSKRIERQPGYEKQGAKESFLERFETAVRMTSGSSRPLNWIDEPEEMARYDSRGYVAYLIADGNSMGQLFRQCQSPEQMKALSNTLADTVRSSLAEPVAKMMSRQQKPETQGLLPALPLILGGDDVFVLLPAPWALDFARDFCLNYERRMAENLEQINLKPNRPPTMTAAVIICKSSYPYRLAHKRGETLLQEAKRISKNIALNAGTAPSMVHFAVILGNQLEGIEEAESYRPSLAPYLVRDKDQDLEKALQWTVAIAEVIQGRYKLRHLPARRRAQLRELFSLDLLPSNDDEVKTWDRRLQKVLDRIGRQVDKDESEEEAEHNKAQLVKILESLGVPDQIGFWRTVKYLNDQVLHAQGLPDLLEAWDFAYDLDRQLAEYREEEL